MVGRGGMAWCFDSLYLLQARGRDASDHLATGKKLNIAGDAVAEKVAHARGRTETNGGRENE
jgi:hypothetical protein